MTAPVIQIMEVNKSFRVGTQDVPVLKGINVSVDRGDFLIIFGPSGCGKSTLLHTILGLEPPTQGSVSVLDTFVYNLPTEDDRSEFRKLHIGMVYQQPNWIKSLSVVENVAFPLALLGIDAQTRYTKAANILKSMNLGDWIGYIPTELSSGQQQRVSLARALVTNPEIIVADEPTGNLDFEAGQELMTLLTRLNNEQQKTIIMVTHDLEYLQYSKSAVRMFDGSIVEKYNENTKSQLLSSIKGKRGSGNAQ